MFLVLFPVVQDMALDDVGGPLDADFSAVLALQRPPIACLAQKQTHFITGAAVRVALLADNKLNHPAGAVPESFHGQNVMAFQLPNGDIAHTGSFLSVPAVADVCAAMPPAA